MARPGELDQFNPVINSDPAALPETATTQQQEHSRHRLSRWGAGLLLAGTYIGIMHGISTPTETTLAGAPIEVQIERGNDTVLNLSPLGALDFGKSFSAGSFRFGTESRFSGDFAIGTAGDQGSLSSPEAAAAYLQLYNDPRTSITTIKQDVLQHVADSGLTGLGMGMTADAALLLAAKRMSKRRQQAFSTAFEAPAATRRAAAVVAIGGIVCSGYFAIPTQAPFSGAEIPALAETPLAGVKASGVIYDLADTVGSYAKKFIDETNAFDDKAKQNFLAAFQESGIKPSDNPDIVTILAYSDRHCNNGMDRVIAAAAKAYKINLTVSAGDDDMSGTSPFEQICTGDLYSVAHKAAPDGMITVRGNHDSKELTVPYEKKQGYKVLDNNKISSYDKVSFIGSGDPRRSIFLQGTVVPSGQSEQDALDSQSQALLKAACANDQPVDIALIHDPTVGETVARSGCVRLVLDGHVHSLHDPIAYQAFDRAPSYQKILGTTGGAKTNSITIGKPLTDATITVIRYNRETHEPISESNIIVHPEDASVTITPFTPYAPAQPDVTNLADPNGPSSPSPETTSGEIAAIKKH